jgi:hypothetical protein
LGGRYRGSIPPESLRGNAMLKDVVEYFNIRDIIFRPDINYVESIKMLNTIWERLSTNERALIRDFYRIKGKYKVLY